MSDNLVEMARLAQHDERMATGALYGDLADRIEELEAANRGLVRLNEATEARAKTAEAKLSESEALLAKAVGALKHIEYYDIHAPTHARNTLKELTGGEDE